MLSIRARVLAATLGLVLVGLVASAGAIYGALQWVLVAHLDQQLESIQHPVVTAMDQLDRERQLASVVPPGSFVKVFDSHGSEIYSFVRPEMSPLRRRTGAALPSRRYALGGAAARTGTRLSRLSRASASRGTA